MWGRDVVEYGERHKATNGGAQRRKVAKEQAGWGKRAEDDTEDCSGQTVKTLCVPVGKLLPSA